MSGARNWLGRVLGTRWEELPLVLLMLGYFFAVIVVFWILKPLKKTLFLGYYRGSTLELGPWTLDGPQAELVAKIGNMVVALVTVVIFTHLVRRFRRQQLTLIGCGFAAVCLLGFWPLLRAPAEPTVWAFYLFGDLFNTFMVATFFAFLADSFAPEAARRNYGPIVFGGVAGGAFGSLAVALWIKQLSLMQWLWICLAGVAVIAALATVAGRLVARNPPPERPAEGSGGGSAALEGARLVARSRYLLALVAMVAIYEIVSTILDFQFTRTVVTHVAAADQGAYFSTVYTVTNVFAMGVQLLLTGLLLRKAGVGTTLLLMPAAVILVSAGFLALPILLLGSAFNTVDNGLNYSVNQSAREALYTVTSRDEKYKAKAFIDMFVQRAAKVVAVVAALVIDMTVASASGIRVLSVVVLALTALWLLAARYAGRRFKELEGK